MRGKGLKPNQARYALGIPTFSKVTLWNQIKAPIKFELYPSTRDQLSAFFDIKAPKWVGEVTFSAAEQTIIRRACSQNKMQGPSRNWYAQSLAFPDGELVLLIDQPQKSAHRKIDHDLLGLMQLLESANNSDPILHHDSKGLLDKLSLWFLTPEAQVQTEWQKEEGSLNIHEVLALIYLAPVKWNRQTSEADVQRILKINTEEGKELARLEIYWKHLAMLIPEEIFELRSNMEKFASSLTSFMVMKHDGCLTFDAHRWNEITTLIDYLLQQETAESNQVFLHNNLQKKYRQFKTALDS